MNIEEHQAITDLELAKCTYTGNNCITSEWMQKHTIVEFVIEYGFASIKSSRCNSIFKPCPKTWLDRGILPNEAITKLGINTDVEYVLQTISGIRTDELLLAKIGVETYGFIKFLLHMNKAIQIQKINLIYLDATECEQSLSLAASATSATSNKDNTPQGLEKSTVNILICSRINQFKLTYTSDVEARFQSSNTVYRFHGTPAENIIPILANGLKDCSLIDELRLNGAVHGNGIYLSDSAEFSIGYCRSSEDGHMAMLVYEVIDSQSWFKTNNIFVVNDERAIILRYIIVIRNYTKQDIVIFEKLTRLVNCGMLKASEKKKEDEKQIVLAKAFNKRLMMEYKHLMKKSAIEIGFSMRLTEEDNLRKWSITITKIENAELEAQMRVLNIPFIELEVTFPEAYPIEPPFPRVIYPRFKSLTGHITVGGSICMEAISKKGWIPTTNMEALIMQIKLVLAEGEARIDEANSGKRYDMIEAQEAFQRSMAIHGWS
jgi:ubiquitin-conjugating enzyme E2 Q